MQFLSSLAGVAFAAIAAQAQVTHYSVKLTPDLERHTLTGEEDIQFSDDTGVAQWQTSSLKITRTTLGKRHRHFEYVTTPARGLAWIPEGGGFVTAFYCDAWMVCDNRPNQRATLTLEVVLPVSSHLTAVGPGQLTKRCQVLGNDHFLFDQREPVQTYLFSFGVAKLETSAAGKLSLYAQSSGHGAAFSKTADVYRFFLTKAGVKLSDSHYVQAFLPIKGLAQEAAGMALMSEAYLSDLETNDDVRLLAHELAHQWWGVLVGIRSWSDFWLNEGMAEFMSNVYLEHHSGKAAYDRQMRDLQARMNQLRDEGQNRPLHWVQWKERHEALGEIPYVKEHCSWTGSEGS